MNDRDQPLPVSDEALSPVERAAAEWVVRRGRGLNEAEQAEFLRWLGQSPTHASVYTETAETSRLLDAMASHVPADTAAFRPANEGTAGELPAERRRGRGTLWLGGAAAAAAAVVLAALVGRHFSAASAVFQQSYEADFGATREVKLPDGSVVELNSESGVDVRFDAGERRLRLLKGEAFFTVAKNPARPFWVEAGPVAVRAVGTEFNVRIRSDEVSVLVAEGRVRVVAGDGEERAAAAAVPVEKMGSALQAGQLAELATLLAGQRAAAPIVVTSVDPRAMKSALAWQRGRLEFFETPLSEVVAQFNRYNHHQIRIADPELAARRFGGAFDAHQVEPLLELLQQSFGVVTEERDGATVIRAAR